jgi:hypothetical protein
MPANALVGAWRLVSCELRTADGQVSYPFGRDPLGYILYSENGYMSVAFMSALRGRFSAGDIRGGSPEEKVEAADSYLSYCGRYEIWGSRVIHHVEVSFFPNWVGLDQERLLRLEGDTLYLSTPPMLVAGQQQTSHLIWQRT